jgi:hypothetical protein
MIWTGATSAPSRGAGGGRPWPRAKRHFDETGTAFRGERRMRGPDLACDPSVLYVDASAESCCAAAARSGIIGLTIRDSSCCHWMAVGIRRMRGRLSAARSCVCSAAKCVRPRRRGCHAFVLFTHSAWVWPGAIRRLGSDLRSGQRRAYQPNMPALALRRVVASGHFFTRRTWA